MFISGVRFDNVSMKEAVNRVLMYAQQKRPRHVCTGNLDHLRLANELSSFYETYWDADLVVADGAPIVWLSKAQGEPLKERVTGIDLFERVCAAASNSGLRVYLLGGFPGSAQLTKERLEREHPGINVVGVDCPHPDEFLDGKRHDAMLERIAKAKPQILFVALGAPKQELWISSVKHRINVPVSIGVGGAFEMYAGIAVRAPMWVQKVGFEWLFRLTQEPTRLFERYVLRDMPFLAKAIAHVYAKRKNRNDENEASVLAR
jgi:N-acetylglucosaminyldiphosphoundecaprenol N-acetyl-beta-D-mannosaminyltransferase